MKAIATAKTCTGSTVQQIFCTVETGFSVPRAVTIVGFRCQVRQTAVPHSTDAPATYTTYEFSSAFLSALFLRDMHVQQCRLETKIVNKTTGINDRSNLQIL